MLTALGPVYDILVKVYFFDNYLVPTQQKFYKGIRLEVLHDLSHDSFFSKLRINWEIHFQVSESLMIGNLIPHFINIPIVEEGAFSCIMPNVLAKTYCFHFWVVL